MLPLTPAQTVGPFFAILVPERGRLALVTDETPGERIVLEGVVRDGIGQPVPDALLEIWQANAAGRCNHPEDPRTNGRDPAFDGFGRVHTDARGGFHVETIKPGSVPGPRGRPQAPHLMVGLFARGLLTRLVTRIYFDDEPGTPWIRSWRTSSRTAGRHWWPPTGAMDGTTTRSCSRGGAKRCSSMSDGSDRR